MTPEAMTLAQQLVNRQKTKTELINDGFNRYSFNSKEDLPSWFLDDETKHYKSNLPVTKEAIAALRAKQRALDARPIKKVAEAKARKKHRTALRLEKAMKKAQVITEMADMTEKEKAAQIEKLMRSGAAKAKSKRAKEKVQVIVAKGANRGVKGRPKGTKGRYTMVDPRMKKEVCPGVSTQCHEFNSIFSCVLRSVRKKPKRNGNVLNDFHQFVATKDSHHIFNLHIASSATLITKYNVLSWVIGHIRLIYYFS